MNSPFSLLKGFFEGGREEPAADAGTEACRSFEEGYDAVEQEYLSVLEILKAGEGDPAGLSRALSEAEQRLSEKLERLETKADEIEARAGEKMAGDDLEVMLKRMPSLFGAARNDAAVSEISARRGARIEELQRELEARKAALDSGTAEQLQRVMALLEGISLSGEVTGMLGSIF